MKRFFLLPPLLLLFACGARAQTCNGASPAWTAASVSLADVQACFNKTLHCGDVINIPSGSATWNGLAILTPPSGCAANQGITVQGATACTAGCAAGSGGTALAFTDNTNITLGLATTSAALDLTGCRNTAFCRVTGLTMIPTINPGTGLTGAILVTGIFGEQAFRIDHVHVITSGNGNIAALVQGGYGLIDHLLMDDTSTVPGNGVAFGGDFASHGYANWNAATTFGTNQFMFVEDSRFNWTHPGGDGTYDGYFGANVVIRHNYINQQVGMGGHGTDSGGYRSTVLAEVYNNTIVCGGGGTVMNTRGGTVLFHFNTINNGIVTCHGVNLQYFRLPPYVGPEMGFWGGAGFGINWTPLTTAPTGNSNMVTANAPDWAANHAYVAFAVIDPLLNNAGTQNFQTLTGCTSGGTEPNPWTQLTNGTIGTTPDGTCNWTNVGGFVPGIVTTAGFCAAHPDTMASSNAACNAVVPGDTATRFFDTNGGIYPYRDTPGTIHDQLIFGNYNWGNSGTGLVTPLMGTDANTNKAVVLDRDFFTATTGLLSARPTTGFVGQGYWATDTNNLYTIASSLGHSYSTTPTVAENPISQSGIWVNGGIAGIDWNNVRTQLFNNMIIGTGTSPACSGFGTNCNDNTAVLTGTWTADQEAQARVVIPSPSVVCCHEVELRLLTTIAAHSITGYEINCSVSSNNYAQLVRWNGPVGNFTLIGTAATSCVDGDILKATVIGSSFNVYKNGTRIIGPISDSTYTSGSPGVGLFLNGSDVNLAGFGITDFKAASLGANSAVWNAVYSPYTYPHPLQGGGTPQAGTPVCTPGTGTYSGVASVNCTNPSSAPVECYTTNGVLPATNNTTGCNVGTVVSGAISVTPTVGGTTLLVVAGGTGFLDSAAASNTYTLARAPTPVCTPGTGLYPSNQNVTCTNSPHAPVQCWTLNGSTPTTNGVSGCLNGTVLNGFVSVTPTATPGTVLNVVSGGTGFGDSFPSTTVYTLGTPPIPPPTALDFIILTRRNHE